MGTGGCIRLLSTMSQMNGDYEQSKSNHLSGQVEVVLLPGQASYAGLPYILVITEVRDNLAERMSLGILQRAEEWKSMKPERKQITLR
jgi:hypothetical protein